MVVLSAYEHLPRGRVRFSRLNIYARDGDTCQYFGRTLARSELNLDHVMPRYRGGQHTWENVVSACAACNRRKAGRTPQEAGMKLIRPALPPGGGYFFSIPHQYRQNHDEWRKYLPPRLQ